MLVSEAIQKSYSMAKGKATAPAAGTAKYNQLLSLADSLQKVWAAEPDIQWDALYSVVNIGTVTATNSFELDDTINSVVKRETDPIYLSSGSSRVDYSLVKPNQLYINRDFKAVAQAGRNLVFPTAFTSDSPQFGYSINVPSILYPNEITAASDEIQVPEPMWLVFMMAAEFIATDVVRQNQRGKNLEYAVELMRKMKQDNQGQYEDVATEWNPLGEDWA